MEDEIVIMQCPLCGGDWQHETHCFLNGKDHIYMDDTDTVVDWFETFRLNQIQVVSERAQ